MYFYFIQASYHEIYLNNFAYRKKMMYLCKLKRIQNK